VVLRNCIPKSKEDANRSNAYLNFIPLLLCGCNLSTNGQTNCHTREKNTYSCYNTSSGIGRGDASAHPKVLICGKSD